MNPTLIAAFLRQRATSPIRLVFLATVLGFPLLAVAVVPMLRFSQLDSAFMLALVFGAGMIGQDATSGVLQLVFARPVSRTSYVLSRWLAASLAAAVIAAVQVAAVAAIMTARGVTPGGAEVAYRLANLVTSAFGATAPLLAFSALLPGLADLGMVLLIYTVAGLVAGASGMLHDARAAHVAKLVQDAINPPLDWRAVIASSPAWQPLVFFVAAVLVALAVAIVAMRRKELSYATSA